MTLIIQFATDGKLLAWSNSIVYSRLSSAKKDLEVTVNARVNTSQEPAAAAEGWTLGYVTRSADITGGTCYPPLFDTAEAASGLWHPLVGSQVKTDVGEPRKTQQRATKVVKLQQETCGKRLGVLGLLTLAERRLTGDLIAACSYLRGSCKDHEAKLFLAVPDAIIRDNVLKLWLGSFRFETCPPEYFQDLARRMHGCHALVLEIPVLWVGPLTGWPPEVSSSLHFCDSTISVPFYPTIFLFFFLSLKLKVVSFSFTPILLSDDRL